MLNVIIAILQIMFGIGLFGFWIYFFLVENKDPEKSEVYLVFEKSFVIPDLGWIAPCLFISAIGLITNQTYWIFFSIASGSAILFLFLMDFSFNLQQGNYKKTKRKEKFGEIIINILCIIAGPLFMAFGFINL
jgi:hypothetical protein